MMMPSPIRFSPPTVTFWGAAQSVTGSMHLVEFAGFNMLLDCGLVMGSGSEARQRNGQFPFDPKSIGAVVLSHAHIDHCGNLPNLVRQGFAGPIYCTPATRDLLGIMLADSARIQEEEVYVEKLTGRTSAGPLYTRDDVARTVARCEAVAYETPLAIHPHVQLRLVDAGHLLGSAMVSLLMKQDGHEYSVTFTGDLGRRGLPFLHKPSPVPEADMLICESTYGGRTHQPLAEMADAFAGVVSRTIQRGGKVLIPAFNLGRAQVVVHYLEKWMDQGKLPEVPLYVDSPLAAEIADLHQHHAASLAERLSSGPRQAPAERGHVVHYVRSLEDSRALSKSREPCVIVASGGMCEAGRILRHLQENIDDPRASIVLVSYQSPLSLGRKLLERGPTVRFRGRNWNKWADVMDVQGFSGHADHDDFLHLLGPLAGKTRRVRLVHGDRESSEALSTALRNSGFGEVEIPWRGDKVSVA
jgi:metallo-beta-lactamase family protein